MSMHGYNVCLLDILGFSKRIKEPNGLEKIKDVYLKLMESVSSMHEEYDKQLSSGIFESAYWSKDLITSKPKICVLYKINALYGSDTILIWSNRTWKNHEDAGCPVDVHLPIKWSSYPKPCDPFIEICNEVICRSIELGLPLRGALSTGECYFDFDKHIYIGKPIVEASELEKLQRIIGASFCNSFEEQIIPKRFYFTMDKYIKGVFNGNVIDPSIYTNQNVLDWPRYWRKTRKADLKDAIDLINFGEQQDIKDNTLRMIDESEKFYEKYISYEESEILHVYKEYFNFNSGLPIRKFLNGKDWEIADIDYINTTIRGVK